MSTSDQRCDYLFLSPHLDDVVLSCALRLLEARRENKTVQVVTIFSKAMKILPGWDLYKGRQREDEQALNMLGVNNPLWLDFNDAPFRNLFYTNFRSIILGKHAQDNFCAEQICNKVISICKNLAPQTIFIPLAVGTHVDHRLVHNIWHSLPPHTSIIFYEDRPYVFLPHSLNLRLAEIGARPLSSPLSNIFDDTPHSLRVFAKGLSDITMYKNVLTRKKDRFRYLLWARRKMKLIQEPSLKIESEIIATTSMEDVTQIENAIGAYKSQMGLLYKNLDIFKQESLSYAHTLETNSLYAERYWKLVH